MTQQIEFCDKPFSLEDLTQVLSQNANDTALGLDGFSYEFYVKAFWDMFNPYLLQVYKKAMMNRSLGSIVNKGNVKFIPKTRDIEIITN